MDRISLENFTKLIKPPIRPLVIDVRGGADYAASAGIIPGAIRREADAVALWVRDIELARPIVAYGSRGDKVSPGVSAALRAAGHNAFYLQGGFQAWAANGGLIAPKPGAPTRWVTRERPKIDRIACPWLIRRFIDPDSQFLYVPASEVLKVASETGAVPYDIPGVPFTHRGERCSFDAFLEDYSLAGPALAQLACIVRGADTDSLGLAPEAAGLFAISLGLSANIRDDQTMLRHGLVIYDALYAWIVSAQGETHHWPPLT